MGRGRDDEQVSKLSSARTQTVHWTVSILRIALFDSLFFTSKKEVSKMTLPFLAQKERLELSRRLPDLRP